MLAIQHRLRMLLQSRGVQRFHYPDSDDAASASNQCGRWCTVPATSFALLSLSTSIPAFLTLSHG